MADSSAQPRTPQSVSPLASEGDENIGRILQKESSKLEELKESRAELLARVQSLKKDLQEWRGKLDNQVKNYRQELGELRNTLNTEVEQLQFEFQDLRTSIRKQLDATSNLSIMEKLVMPSNLVKPHSPKKISMMAASPKKTLGSLDNLSSPPKQRMAKLSSPVPKVLSDSTEANFESDE